MSKYSWLERSFGFYASYHDNSINKLIHIFCVWPILWTAVLFLQYTSEVPGLESVAKLLPVVSTCTYAFPIAAFYFFYYLVIELPGVVGPFASLLVLFSYVSTAFIKDEYADHEPWKLGIIVHVVCWIAQFYGHGVHEGRSPALFDNLFQAFIMAPLFVLMEVFFMLGYKPGFQSKISEIVKENKKKFASQSAQKTK